ncbi:MAG: efflux RND transporter periplasmic adaptor subunit [Betaproteobacteria bacterium]
MPRISPALISVFVFALAIAGCKGSQAPQKGATAPPTPLVLSAEDLHTIRSSALSSGPAITGSIQPERKADVRAEVSATVLRVMKENGEQVRRGDVLVKLDDTSIRDALASAEASSRAAGQSLEQSQRQFDRMKTLRTQGMVSLQGLEDAEVKRNNLQSDLEASKARVVQARQQLQRTEARAPFDGVVSERKVSPGDTAQIGKELLKVIDPTSMRFEALVAADQVGGVRPGQAARFRVNGYGDQEFSGKVRRVNPAANPTTRQVELLVDLVGDKQPKLAGLYAEGRVETEARSSLTIPASAVIKDGDSTFAWRVAENKVTKTPLAVTERDVRSGDYVLKSGLAEGDQVIRYPTAALKDNQPVQGSSAPTKAAMAETKSP